MLPGDYRFEHDPVRALDDVRSASSLNHMQHVFCKQRNVHVVRRDSKGIVRCSWKSCVLNVGREPQA